ncbi:hypothetical protein [Cellulomonas terrae]|uniref:Uncharacterized protein n=1 Tax=Cellulomonas terrae TaxID=311234 RepID=A0A511JMC2_9CELL|nr:hypothetical protein [Cellulomonas terrae]GEL99069.1 hypothetical protein CTE05_26160 [Cellulomonas terrae]
MTSSAAARTHAEPARSGPDAPQAAPSQVRVPGGRGLPVPGLSRAPAGEPGTRRDAGPRDGRASVEALRRQHLGSATLRRVKILGPRGALHINDYHFIDRLTLGSAPRSGQHDVIVTEFTDFDGLAVQANAHAGEEFDFGGVRWGWNGPGEIFPIENGKTCIRLSTAQIEELISAAKEGADVKKAIFKGLSSKVTVESKVIEGFKSVRQQRSVPVRVDLPITTTANKLRGLGKVRFAPGSYWTDALEKGTGNAEAFLMGPNGSKEEGPHLHLFLATKAKKGDVSEWDHPFTITGYLMTTSHKKHLVLDPDGVAVDKKTLQKPALEKTEPAQVEEMTLLCGLLRRAGASEVEVESKGTTSQKKKVVPEKKTWKSKTDVADDLDKDVATLAKGYSVRPVVMRHFLVTIAGLQADDIAALAARRSTLDDAGFGTEVDLLPALDLKAADRGVSADVVVGMLDPTTYPTDTEGITLMYKKLMDSLDQ